MVRHNDPGIPDWMKDSGESAPMDPNREIAFTVRTTETVLRTYEVSTSVTIRQLIDRGYLDSDDSGDRDIIQDAVREAISDGVIVDRWDDDDPEYGDGDWYDDDYEIDDWGDE
jgi:hypothetical protein